MHQLKAIQGDILRFTLTRLSTLLIQRYLVAVVLMERFIGLLALDCTLLV